jgi:hypothetical protein
MLTTALQQSVTIKTDAYLGLTQYSYTCYGDSTDKNIYYVVPEIPVFSAKDDNPVFMFYKYRGTDQAGGYAMFTVELPQPTEAMKAEIKSSLIPGLTPQLNAKSKLIVAMIVAHQAFVADPKDETKQTTYHTALNSTGLDNKDAAKYEALYDSKKPDTQFLVDLLPDGGKNIKLQSPNFNSASASLIIDDNKSFYREVPTPIKPSGLGNNSTVFSMSLTGDGATIFQDVLEGTDSNSSVGIRFDFGLDASLPAAKVTVTYDSKKMKSVSQTITRNTWSADEKNITRKFTSSGAIDINVATGLTAKEMGMTPEQYNTWKAGLTKWGQTQVEQILSSQTGLDMSMNLLNDAGSFDKFSESLTQTESFTRVYEENSVVSYNIAPQTQLPSIMSLVGAKKIPDFFKAYDLNDPFFKTIQPIFYASGNLEKYNISSIVVTAKYEGQNGIESSTLTFDASTKGPLKTDAWFTNEKIGANYSYQYTVNFTGMHAKPFVSDEIKIVDTLVQSINLDQCGVVYANITSLIPESAWDILSSVEFTTQYADVNKGIEEKIDKQVINKTTLPKPYIYPIGSTPENPVYFKAKYTTTKGQSFNYLPTGALTSSAYPGLAATRADQIEVADALPIPRDYHIIITPDPKKGDISFLGLTMEVNYPDLNFKQSQSIAITKGFDGTIQETMSFHFLPNTYNEKPNVTYSLQGAYSAGANKPIDLKDVAVDSDFVLINL